MWLLLLSKEVKQKSHSWEEEEEGEAEQEGLDYPSRQMKLHLRLLQR